MGDSPAKALSRRRVDPYPVAMKARAVFLDRDGTLIEDKDYLSRPEQVRVYPGVTAALRRLQMAGFKLIMVTNQSGVGRGYFTMAEVENVHRHLATLFEAEGVRFDKLYIARKHPASRAGAASLLRSFFWTRATSSGLISGKATWWATS